MTKPARRRTIRKADDPDPGSYAESDITPEDRKRGKPGPHSVPVHLTCSHCTKEYVTSPSRAMRHKGQRLHYCSIACLKAATTTREIKPCLFCGAPMEIGGNPYRPGKIRQRHVRFCSSSCAKKYEWRVSRVDRSEFMRKAGWTRSLTISEDGCLCRSNGERKLERWLLANGLPHWAEVKLENSNFKNDRLVRGHDGRMWHIEVDGMGRYRDMSMWNRKMSLYKSMNANVFILKPKQSFDRALAFLK